MEVHQPLFTNKSFPYMLNFRNDEISHDLLNMWRDKYRKATEHLKFRLYQLISELDKKGVYENSLVIVVSDHGELLGEHGKILHGTFLYDELLRVPLMIKYPKSWEVEITPNQQNYISLTKLPGFIKSLISGKTMSDEYLYSPTVFSESYGVSNPIKVELLSEDEKAQYNEFNKYRIAVYSGPFKAIFNVSDWRFEGIQSYDPKREVTDEVSEELKKQVVKFLNSSSMARFPKKTSLRKLL